MKKATTPIDFARIRNYLTDLDIVYSRTLGGDNDKFDMPTDWHAWMPTAHHDNPAIYEEIRQTLAQYPTRAVSFNLVGPFTILHGMRQMENIYLDVYENPEGLHRVLDKIWSVSRRVLENVLNMGLDVSAIFFLDDIAAQKSLLFSPKYTTFNTFGKLPEEQNMYTLNFEFTRSDGTTQIETIDITSMFSDPIVINEQWILLEKEIDIIPPIGGGGGMTPGVDEWGDIWSDIQL